MRSPAEARSWLAIAGPETHLRYQGTDRLEHCQDPGDRHPLRDAAESRIEELGAGRSAGGSEPAPLLPVELAMLFCVGDQQGLLLDLIAARLNSDGTGPRPEVATSVRALARLIVLDPGTQRSAIWDLFVATELTARMARMAMCLGGFEASQLDPKGTAHLALQIMSESANEARRIPSPVGGRHFVDQYLGDEVILESAWVDGVVGAMELRAPRPPGAAGLAQDAPHWHLPVELARPLGHGQDEPFGHPA